MTMTTGGNDKCMGPIVGANFPNLPRWFAHQRHDPGDARRAAHRGQEGHRCKASQEMWRKGESRLPLLANKSS